MSLGHGSAGKSVVTAEKAGSSLQHGAIQSCHCGKENHFIKEVCVQISEPY